MSQLIISDLKVGYKKNEVIHGLNIEVNSGERVALLGANGAGKSTVLKTISGLLTPSGALSDSTGTTLVEIHRLT